MKKGQFDETNRLILLLVGVVLLLLLFIAFKALFEQESKDLTCKASILQVESTGIGSIDCPVQKITVKQEQIDNEVAKAVIAERMANCWDNFGKGKHKPFDQDFLGRGEIICKICDSISFERGVKVPELTEFRSFLRTTKSARFSSMYSEFLYEEFDGEFDRMVPDTIETDNTYYTVYQVYKPDRIGPEDVHLGFLTQFRVDSTLWLVSGEDLNEIGKLRCQHEYD